MSRRPIMTASIARVSPISAPGSVSAVFAARVAPVVGLSVLLALTLHPTGRAGAQAAMSTAQRTFLSDCAVCHGERATGTSHGPSLAGVGAASIDYELST